MPPQQTITSPDATDSPFTLLGRAIADACADPHLPSLGLQALVVYAAEYARLHDAAYPDFLAALESCIRLHTEACDQRQRRRVAAAIHHWAALAWERHERGAGDHLVA